MKRHELLNSRIDRLLIRIAIGLGIALLVSQSLLQLPGLRSLLTTVDSLEGVPYIREQKMPQQFTE